MWRKGHPRRHGGEKSEPLLQCDVIPKASLGMGQAVSLSSVLGEQKGGQRGHAVAE